MIIYFSSTGNSQFVAEQIAAATNDKVISIRQVLNGGEKNFTLAENENFGVVLPTYFGGFPSVVKEFFEQIKINVEGENHYSYFVATCGGGAGNINLEAEKNLQNFGLKLDAEFVIFMVDNWTPFFDLTDKKYIEQAESKVEPALKEIIEKISRQEKIKIPASISAEDAKKRYAIYENLRYTKNFTVNEHCVGCGKCARQCPLKVIEIQNKKPVWIKEKCTLCFGCLHVCPKNAINFNNQTEGRGQYHNPRIKKII